MMEETSPIKSFLKKASEKMGSAFDEVKADSLIKDYGHDYGKLVDDVGTKFGISPDKLTEFRERAFKEYSIAPPDDTQKAEIDFVETPEQEFSDDTHGFEKYSKYEEERTIAQQLLSNLESQGEEREGTYTQATGTAGVVTTIPTKETYYAPEIQSRIDSIHSKIENIDKRISEQADYNLSNYDAISQQHQATKQKFKEYDKAYDEAINAAGEHSTTTYNNIAGSPGAPIRTYRPEDRRKITNLKDIRSMYKKIGKVLESPQGKDFGSQLEGLWYGLTQSNTASDFFSLGLNEMGRNINVKDAFDKYQAAQEEASDSGVRIEQRDEVAMNMLDEEEQALLETYQMLQGIQSGSKANTGGIVGEGLQDMLPFILEFSLTSGTSVAAKKVVKEFIKNKTKSAIAAKIAGGVAKVGTQAAIMPSTAKGYAERRAPKIGGFVELVEGEDASEALVKSFLTTAAEVIGEDAAILGSAALRKKAIRSLANDPGNAAKFMNTIAARVSAETGVPSVQGVPFELMSEEVTGILQAAIDQDGSFFTSESQWQLLLMTSLAGGGAASFSAPRRFIVNKSYNESEARLNDLTNTDYVGEVNNIVNNIADPEEQVKAFDMASKQFELTKEEYNTGKSYVINSIRKNQVSIARSIQIEKGIQENGDDNGNVSTFTSNGKKWYVKTGIKTISDPTKIVIAKNEEGQTKAFSNKVIGEVYSQTPEEVVNTIDMEDEAIDKEHEQSQTIQDQAAERGIEIDKTVESPNGKGTVASINPDGTVTIAYPKGEGMNFHLEEIEPYKTQEQKEEEKQVAEAVKTEEAEAKAKAEEAAIEPKIVSEENQTLPDNTEITIVNLDDGTAKIITDNGEQAFKTTEERDNALKGILDEQIEQAKGDIDSLEPEARFRKLGTESPKVARTMLQDDINELKAQANELTKAETNTKQERLANLTQAEQIENEAARLETLLEITDQELAESANIQEEVAEIVPETTAENTTEVTEKEEISSQKEEPAPEVAEQIEETLPEAEQALDITPKAAQDLKKRQGAVNAINNMVKEFGVKVKVIHSSEMSEAAREKEKETGASPEAYYDINSQTAYVFSDRMTKVSKVKADYLHEAVLHKGLDILFSKGEPVTILGKEYNSKDELLLDMFGMLDEKLTAEMANRYGIIVDEETTDEQRREVAEEVLASWNELDAIPSRLNNFINSIWKKFKKMAGMSSNQLTKTDLLNFLKEHREMVKAQTKPTETIQQKPTKPISKEQQTVNKAQELIEEFRSERQSAPYNQLEEWQQDLVAVNVNKASFERYADKNEIGSGLARAWFAPAKQKTSSINNIDAIAQVLSDKAGREITTQDVVDFITANPTKAFRKSTGRMNEVRAEYKALTGTSLNNHDKFIKESGIKPEAKVPEATDERERQYDEAMAKLAEIGITPEQINDEPGMNANEATIDLFGEEAEDLSELRFKVEPNDNLTKLNNDLKSAKRAYNNAISKWRKLNNKMKDDPSFSNRGQVDIFGQVAGSNTLDFGDTLSGARKAVANAKAIADVAANEINTINRKIKNLNDKSGGQGVLFKLIDRIEPTKDTKIFTPTGLNILKQRLEQHKGTPWAESTKKAIAIQDDISNMIEGKEPKYIEGKLAEMIKNNGEEGIWMYFETAGMIGNAAKPVNNISTSLLNCNPSKNCAQFCYACKGNYSYAHPSIKSEVIEYALNKNPERLGEVAARQYKSTQSYMLNKALRLEDKGDINPNTIAFVDKLNREGVRTHIFSKKPEVLTNVSDKNIRLLSIDESNQEVAADNDLQIAYVYSGSESDLKFIEANKDRIQVVLPIKTERKVLDKEIVDKLPSWTNKNQCPIDNGRKTLKEWNCTSCDSGKGIGCYSGQTTESVDLNKEKDYIYITNKIKDDINKLPEEYRNQLLAELRRVEAVESTSDQSGANGQIERTDTELNELEGQHNENQVEFNNTDEVPTTINLDNVVGGTEAIKEAMPKSQKEVRFSLNPEVSESASFKQWSKDAPVLEGWQVGDAEPGKPQVFKVHHGTTHEFYTFDPSEKGMVEGHFGKVNYFTSDKYDANQNYAGEGPDLTNRIEQRKDQIEQDIENWDEEDIIEVSERLGLTFDQETETYPDELPEALAKEELVGGEGHLMDLYVRLDNPVVINGENETWIDPFDEEIVSDYRDQAKEEVLDENDATEDQADEFEDDINERFDELMQDEESLITTAAQQAAWDNGIDEQVVIGALPEEASYGFESISASSINKAMRENDELSYAEDKETGTLISTQVIADFFKHLGYDGIVLAKAKEQFSNMDMSDDAAHVHVFPENKNQIKLADGTNTEFSTSDDIRFKIAPPTDTKAFKRWFGNSETVDKGGNPKVMYHGTKYDFSTFEPNEDGAIFVSDNSRVANEFADGFLTIDAMNEAGQNPSIMPVYVKVENAWDYQNKEHVDALINAINVPIEHKDAKYNYAEDYLSGIRNGEWEYIEMKLNEIKELGYDGFYVREAGNKNLGVFSPNQIKSATGNRGTFDPENADIRFKVAESKQELDEFVKDSEIKKSVYHGTDKQFDEFESTQDVARDFPEAIYLSSNKRVSETYGNRIIKSKIKLENPYYYDANGRSFNKAYDDLKGVFDMAISGGRDGVVITNIYDDWAQNERKRKGTTYAVFSPEQILIESQMPDTRFKVDQAATETDTNPSEAQIKAGNYKKGKFWMDGLNIAIENPEGSDRHGNELAAHYGYIKGTIGADGDQIDVFIGEDPSSDKIFVIDQQKKNKRFDESKILVSFTNVADAANAYLSSYKDGWQGMGSISETDIDSFKEWLKNGNTTKRFKAGEAWSKVYPGISNLVANEGQMPEPKQQIVQGLRGERDKSLLRVDEKLQEVPGGRREKAALKADIGQGGQQRELLQGELQMGDTGSTVKESEKRASDRIQGKEDVPKGMGRGAESAAGDIKDSDKVLQVDDRESIYYTRWKSKKKLEDDNLQGGDIADVGDEQKAQRELRDTKESDLQGVERERSDRREDPVRFKITEESTSPELADLFERLEALRKVNKANTRKEELDKAAKSTKTPEFLKDDIKEKLNTFREGVKAGTKHTKEQIDEIETAITKYIGQNLDLGEAGARDINSAFTALRNAKRSKRAVQKAFEKIDELTGKVEIKKQKSRDTSHIKRLMDWMKNTANFVYANNKEFKVFREIDSKTIKQQKIINSNTATEAEKLAADKALNDMWNELDAKVEERTMLEDIQMKLIEYRRNKADSSPELIAAIREDLQVIYDAAKDSKKGEDIQKALDRKSDREFVKGLISPEAKEDAAWSKRVRMTLNDWVINSAGNWETLLNQLGGQKLRDKFSLILNQANQEVSRQATFDKVLDQAREAYGFKTKEEMLSHLQELKKKDFALVKPNREGERGQGKDQKLSRMDIMDLYNAIKNEGIRNDAYMTYGDISLSEDGSRDTEAQKESGKNRINALIDNLSEADKAFADEMQVAVDSYYSKINEIFIKSKNRDLPKMDNYWPSSAEFANENDAFEQFRQDSMHPSATKERTSHRSVKVADAFDKFVNHVKSGEWYANMALPVTRMNNILKNPNVKDLIVEARGEEFYKTMIAHLQEQGLNPPSKAVAPTGVENLASTVLNNWVTSAIGLSPSVPVKQLLSVINYSENMPSRKWAAGFAKGLAGPKAIKETWEEMMKIPYLKTRIGTGYSEALQYVMNADSAAPRAATGWQKMKNIMTGGTRYGDIAAIVFGGKPYLDYMVNEKGMSYDDAVEQFLLDTLRSQQSPFSSSLSTWQNSKNVIKRSVFAFSNTPSQYMRKMFEANEAYRKGDISKGQLGKVYSIYGFLSSANYVIVGALMSALLSGKDWDDDLLEKVLVQFGISAVGGLPIVKDVAEGLGRTLVGLDVYDDVSPLLEGVNKVMAVGKKLANADADTDKTKLLIEGVKYLTPFAGISSRNIEKIYKATIGRKKTISEAKVKQTDKHLKELSGPKREIDAELKRGNFSEYYKNARKSQGVYREAQAAHDMKSAYSSAKTKATKLEREGQKAQAERILHLIDMSKQNLNNTDYLFFELKAELNKFNNQLN